MIVKTPKPPYYAVIFTSILSDNDSGYAQMAEQMELLVQNQNGFLGVEFARDKIGITISYWSSLEAIRNWKNNQKHQIAQKNGKEIWYKNYTVRIAKVEREYSV